MLLHVHAHCQLIGVEQRDGRVTLLAAGGGGGGVACERHAVGKDVLGIDAVDDLRMVDDERCGRCGCW